MISSSMRRPPRSSSHKPSFRRTIQPSELSLRSRPMASAMWRVLWARSSLVTTATYMAAETSCCVCLFLMGLSTMAVGVVPTYAQAGVWAPVLLVALRLIQGFAVAGGNLRCELHDFRACAVRSARLFRELHSARRASRPNSRSRCLSATELCAFKRSIPVVGLARAVPAQRARSHCRRHHSPRGRGDAGLP